MGIHYDARKVIDAPRSPLSPASSLAASLSDLRADAASLSDAMVLQIYYKACKDFNFKRGAQQDVCELLQGIFNKWLEVSGTEVGCSLSLRARL